MRIAIVDDRLLATETIRRVVTSVPEYSIVWMARSGDEAVAKAKADVPDLILMDLVMPGINGVEATRRIMSSSPCAILVVTATVSGNYTLVYDALAVGAIDAVNTPTVNTSGTLLGGDALLAKISQILRKVKTGSSSTHRPVTATPATPRLPFIVAIGASTGGPQAVADVLSKFPKDLRAAVLITQHITAEFTSGLADWLTQKSHFPVRIAGETERPIEGQAFLAGRDDHLILNPDGTLGYTKHPLATPYRPNVDALFQSLAAHVAKPGIAVVLTGMGRDGAEGLLKLRKLGWTTFAQDAASSVVNGMPDAAVKLGAAGFVLPPVEIGKMIHTHVRVPSS